MRIFMLNLCLILQMISINMQGQGIKFETNLSWDEVKNKADKENKYIFMDGSASWCKPCKEMEEQIFSQEKVGAYFNEKFISVKVQFDSTKRDNNYVKRWYSDAKELKDKYKVNAFPSFLFFSPKGILVHKEIGFKKVDDFIKLSSDALDPEKQFYTILERYRKGNKDFNTMARFVRKAKELGEKEIAKEIGNDYVSNYLSNKNEDELLKKDILLFMGDFTQSSNSKSFEIFYNKQAQVDSIIGHNGYSQSVVDYIITKEQIDPFLEVGSKSEPDWHSISVNIRRKYSLSYAMRTITASKISWYFMKNNWEKYTKYAVTYVEKYGADMSNIRVNNIAWNIVFKYSKKHSELNKAINWMKKVIGEDSTFLPAYDTYANLLYKAGKKEEAIKWEKQALEIAYKKKHNSSVKLYKETVDKMINGKPTWE